MKIIAATQNKGKLAEFYALFKEYDMELISQAGADLLDVRGGVFVMVGEIEALLDLVVVAEVIPQRGVLRYTGHEDKPLRIKVARVGCGIDAVALAIGYPGEEYPGFVADGLFPAAAAGLADAEAGVEVLHAEAGGEGDLLLILKLAGAFRHDDDVCVEHS